MKSNGFNKINTAVFISGNGSNLKNLIELEKIRSAVVFFNKKKDIDKVNLFLKVLLKKK